MPFTFSSTFDWFKHRLLAVSRLLHRRKADYFLNLYNKSNIEPVRDADGAPLKCPICGFLMAELIMENGWSVSSCSTSQTFLMSNINNLNSPRLKIEIISFAYKVNMPPKANLLFDVRFIDNPFWVENLRPLTGLEKSVQDFVFKQNAARDFISAFSDMIKLIIPMQAASVAAKKGTPSEMESSYTIAFGCTGGQHRSVAVAEESARLINKLFPQCPLRIWHREVDDERHILPVNDQTMLNEGPVA